MRADLAGVWLSRYRYPSGDQELEGQHYVVVRQQADHLVAHSLPHSNGSQLRLDLTFNPPVATGTWTERTSPTGHYKRVVYHGSIQLMVDPSSRAIRCRHTTFDQDGNEFSLSGSLAADKVWHLVYFSPELRRRALKLDLGGRTLAVHEGAVQCLRPSHGGGADAWSCVRPLTSAI